MKAKDRIALYEDNSDYKLMPKLPIVISLSGRAFEKATSLLKKPYCDKFAECMYATALRLSMDIDGAVFTYCFNDEIIIIVRNDQNLDTEAWCDNKIQKIASITSSLATLHINRCLSELNLDLIGDITFSSKVFTVPNITEAINVMVSKQQLCFYKTVHLACFYELLNKDYDKNSIKEMLQGTSLDDKIQLLNQECNINFNDYPVSFRRGIACYKQPKTINDTIKYKWTINYEIPIFTKEQSFLNNQFSQGIKYGI